MTRSDRIRLAFWLIVIVLIVGAFAADQIVRDQVCVSAMIQDETSVTYYPEVCR